MLPYGMREESEPRKDTLEIAAAIAGAVILVTCAISNVPHRNQATRAGRAAVEREQDKQSIAQLQMATNQLNARLESTRSELAGLTEGHKSLGTQVTATANKVQQLEATIRQASERLAKFSESGALQKITKERDEALAQTKESDEQVRQLTLKLQKAGIYP
jgi:peptidoglycan hydrolase CwlO-like protein